MFWLLTALKKRRLLLYRGQSYRLVSKLVSEDNFVLKATLKRIFWEFEPWWNKFVLHFVDIKVEQERLVKPWFYVECQLGRIKYYKLSDLGIIN